MVQLKVIPMLALVLGVSLLFGGDLRAQEFFVDETRYNAYGCFGARSSVAIDNGFIETKTAVDARIATPDQFLKLYVEHKINTWLDAVYPATGLTYPFRSRSVCSESLGVYKGGECPDRVTPYRSGTALGILAGIFKVYDLTPKIHDVSKKAYYPRLITKFDVVLDGSKEAEATNALLLDIRKEILSMKPQVIDIVLSFTSIEQVQNFISHQLDEKYVKDKPDLNPELVKLNLQGLKRYLDPMAELLKHVSEESSGDVQPCRRGHTYCEHLVAAAERMFSNTDFADQRYTEFFSKTAELEKTSCRNGTEIFVDPNHPERVGAPLAPSTNSDPSLPTSPSDPGVAVAPLEPAGPLIHIDPKPSALKPVVSTF